MHAYRDQYAQIFNNGRGVVLIAISADPIDELAAWARDDELPFLMASDADVVAGELYGASVERGDRRTTNRSLFVIGPDGRIAHVMAPFREIDPTAYSELAEAIERVAEVPVR
jgi:peroxiredoxin